MQNFSDFYNTACCRIQKQTPKMLTLNLKENWNGKLFMDHFPMMLPYEAEYTVGTEIEIKLNGLSIGIVRIESVRHLPFCRLTDQVSFLNMGKPLQFQAEHLNRVHNEGKTFAPETMMTHLAVGWAERNKINQTILIKEWWSSIQIKSVA